MRVAAALIAGLAMSATPLAARQQDMSAPQEAAPSGSGQPPEMPTTPDAGMAGAAGPGMTAGGGSWADAASASAPGPLYAQLEYLQNVVSTQGAYIAALEKYVMQLKDYNASLRTGRH